MIPPAFLHDMLSRIDIVEVVGRHVELKKAGINHKGLCPFHGEKSPSFIVSPSRQTYHCFGCGVHGNAVGFLMEHTGMGFVDAVKDLAQQVGLAVPDDDSSPAERERAAQQKQRMATLTDVLGKAQDHFRRTLRASPRAIDYLKGRGLSGAVAAQFGLGYAPAGWRGLASVFPRYDDPLLEESGMVIAQEASPKTDGDSDGDTKRYDRFRDRIMFPIRSVQGDVIGFGGRVLDQGEPKYLNSPETPVFSKGRELYGLYEARAALRQRGFALVVEGYMDVVALAQSGFHNAVATLGTACTAEHVQKLFRFTDSVVFSFDGDAAGRRAAGRALEACLPHASDTRTIRFLFLPTEHDPDSYVREHGAPAFEQCISQAVPLSRQLIAAASEDCQLDAAEGRARLVAQARPLVALLPTGVLRGQIIDALAETARVSASELRSQWAGPSARQATGGEDPQGSTDSDGAPRRYTARSRSEGQRRPFRQPLATMASSLDRAVWLLIQRTDLWELLGHEAHDLMSEQSAPYGDFFGWLDRLLHDQGAMAPPAVMAEMATDGQAEAFKPLIQRISHFHDAITDEAQHEMGIIVDRLRLQAVEAELELLAGSEGLSDVARSRQQHLYQQQRELKAGLTRPMPGQA